MTNREAVNWLINITSDIGKAEHRDLWHYEQALSEIREMLEAQTEHEKAQLSQEGTTSDMISRQAAIDALDCINGAEEVLRSLPPVQPEPKEGEWVQVSAQKYFTSASYFYRCSACGVNNVRNTNFCPHCGAKMKGAQNG